MYTLVLDRLHATGLLTNATARELQVCGIAARASGIDRDMRRDHPYGFNLSYAGNDL